MSRTLGILASVFALFLFTSAAHAAGRLTFVDKFFAGGDELDVATYFDPDASPGSKKISLLGIKSGARRISVAFDAGEWPTFTALWNKAVAEQSNSWQDTGTFVETGTDDTSTLKLSAGPGVTFLISSPAHGVQTFLLAQGDMGRFGAAVQKVQVMLADQTSD
ncbi:MAG TPA: hypothetical protein VMD53_07985 [Rhizomicrobium sp.]|nr:hypothetical protein [Rhizomicrobium sp.]